MCCENNYQQQAKHQYLNYQILKEIIDGNEAEVLVLIDVLDYEGSFQNSRDYFLTHSEEFLDPSISLQDINSMKEFIAYQVQELFQTRDRVKYEITFSLSREDLYSDWEVHDISREDLLKIYGLY